MSALEDIERVLKTSKEIVEKLQKQYERIKKNNPVRGKNFYIFDQDLEKFIEFEILNLFLDSSYSLSGMQINFCRNNQKYNVNIDSVFFNEEEVKEFKIKRITQKINNIKTNIEAIQKDINMQELSLQRYCQSKKDLEQEILLLENGEEGE